MEAPLLQIRGDHVEVSDDAEAIAAACRVFRDGGFLRFPALLDAAALRAFGGDGEPRRRIAALLSDPRVLGVVGRIVGDDAAEFRADRAPPLGDEGWHPGPTRRCLAALAVHVGSDACRGSTLEMRRSDRKDVVSIPTTTPGDAVLFRFDGDLEYRMCPGTETVDTTFTGRFVRPDEPPSMPLPRRP
jgi:hypothetical protein